MTIPDAPGIAIPQTPEERLFADIVRNLYWGRYHGGLSCDCLIGQEAEALGLCQQDEAPNVLNEIADHFGVDTYRVVNIYQDAVNEPWSDDPDAALYMAAENLGIPEARADALRAAAGEGQ